MASIPEIYSLPETYSSSLGASCSDQEIISILRKYRGSEVEAEVRRGINHGSAELRPDTWYFASRDYEAMEGWETRHGTWSPKNLVSIPNTSQGNSPNSPKFVGTKTAMEFKPTGGSKAVVGMTRYNLLTTREDGDGLDLDEDLALCHVFPLEGKGKGTRNRNGKRARSGNEFDPRKGVTPADLSKLEEIISKIDPEEYPPLAVDDGSVNVQDLLFADPSKSEPSIHWQSFTKIHTKNSKLVMYAACNHCDTMLKLTGGPSCGTASLKNHNNSFRCKHKQEQLPGNSSSVLIPSIALQAITE